MSQTMSWSSTGRLGKRGKVVGVLDDIRDLRQSLMLTDSKLKISIVDSMQASVSPKTFPLILGSRSIMY